MSILSLYAPRYAPSVWSPYPSLLDPFASFEPLLTSSRSFLPRFEVLGEGENADQNGYTLTLDLPGFKREEVTLEVDHHNVLTVKASRSGRRSQKETLERSITLGDDVNADAISAKLEHGVLTVTVPRRDTPKARQIQVT